MPLNQTPLIERRAVYWLLLVYCLFILYGTFIPFRFVADPQFVGFQLSQFLTPPFVNGVRQFSIPDVISNILLFVPFGFLWVGSGIGRSIFGSLFGASLGIACFGLVFGLGIEFGQIFSPGRTASILDALCNGFGAAIGGGLGHIIFHRLGGYLNAVVNGSLLDRPSVIVLAILVIAFVTDAYYPFEITIDVSTVWQSFKQIQWHPFVGGSHQAWTDLIVEKVFFFAGIAYLAALNVRGISVFAAGVVAWCLCVAFAAALEIGKLFFAGRVPNPENFVMCTAGALVGTLVIVPLTGVAVVRRHSMFILLLLVLGLEVYSELSPFDWVSSVAELRARIATIEWLPFADYYGAAPLAALFDLGKKLLIVAPLGFLVASRTRRGRVTAALVGLVSGAVLETCQIALRTRTPSITDVLLFGVAAWTGAVVSERLSEITRSENSGAAGTLGA